MKLYLDGVDVTGTVTNATVANTADSIDIGSRRSASSECGNASIDEVAVYPTALSSVRVAAHYAAAFSSGPPPIDPATLDGAILRLDPVTGAAMSRQPEPRVA